MDDKQQYPISDNFNLPISRATSVGFSIRIISQFILNRYPATLFLVSFIYSSMLQP